MSLRRKTLAFVVLSIAALVGATLWVVDGLVMRELAQVEHEETVRKVSDVRAVVQRCMQEYGDSFADWSEWDDMATFVADGNQAFLDSNVSLTSLVEQIHADLFIVRRDDGQLVFATQANAERTALESCPEEVLAQLTPQGLMRPGPAYTGLLAFRDRTYIVSSRPIHRSDGGPARVPGRLVAAQRIDGPWIQRLENFTFLDLRFTRTSETPLEEEELEAREVLAGGTPTFVAETGPERISGYGLLQDMFGKPALVLHVERDRNVRVHGREIARWTMMALLSGGLILSLLSIWATGLGALRPLQRLLDGTRKLRLGERTHVIIRSADEFQELAHDFNLMSDAIFEREEALQAAHAELARLLDGMAEAIVTFGPDGAVVGRASRKAHELFGRRVLAGVALRELLYPGADEFDIEAEAFQAWLVVAFTQPIEAWEQVGELAPRQVVLRSGAPDEAYLALEFRAIVVEGRIHRVILLASDQTEKHRLLRQQAERESAHERQLQAMRKLLAGGAQVFVNFVRSSHERLDELAALLLERGEQLDSADIERLFRHAHTLKSEARVFDIEKLERTCGELEDLLSELRIEARTGALGARTHLGPLRELLAAARSALDLAQEMFVHASPIGEAILDQMSVRRSDVQTLEGLAAQLDPSGGGALVQAVQELAARLHARPFGELCSAFVERVPLWARAQGKHARLEIEGLDVPIPAALARRLPGALTHLLRNAVSHGIELPERREQLHKEPIGRVRLVATRGADGAHIRVEDDGAGLDLAALAEEARALGHAIEPGAEWRLVFVDGLSTASLVDEHSGRGVGMGAVRSELARVGYDVELESGAQKFTRIVLHPALPVPGAALPQSAHSQEKRA